MLTGCNATATLPAMPAKSKMVTRGPKNCQLGLERGQTLETGLVLYSLQLREKHLMFYAEENKSYLRGKITKKKENNHKYIGQ